MSAEIFIDTNVFCYAVDATDPRKQQIADDIIRAALTRRDACTSYQVAQEFLNVSLKLARTPLSVFDARRFVGAAIAPLVTVWASEALLYMALDVKSRWGFGFYDSLIVAAAQQSGARTLLTEDLQDGQQLNGLRISNPFS